jgi:RNA polymerase sigma-70 factor (ECF subfamily)
MSEQQDAADVRRVRAGDAEAFAGIVKRWQGPLVTLAFRFCRDRHRAEEMAQEAFLTAFQALGQWRGESAFSSWLFAVAANTYRSQMRRRRLPAHTLDPVLASIEPPSTDSAAEAVEVEGLVRRAVSALPARYRDAIVLFYFHNMDVRQTARSLRLAEGTVKARLHRGRALLRKRLGLLGCSEDRNQHGDR